MKTDTPITNSVFTSYRKAECGPSLIEYEMGSLECQLIEARQAISDLNQRLIERQESFQAQLIRIEDGWREKLREAREDAERLYNCMLKVDDLFDYEIDALKKHEELTAKLLP